MSQTRFFSDVAVDTVLATGISDSATTLEVGATTGFPSSFPYTLVIDPDTASEELVDVQSASGTTLTVIRGYASTGAVTHSTGAIVKHVFTGQDATEANAHAGANQNVHGLSGGATVMGTSQEQTVSGKTMDGGSNTFQNIPQSAITDLETDLATALQDADAVPFTPAGSIAASDVQAAIEELDDEKQAVSQKGVANGYASLDSSGDVPITQLPVGTASDEVAAGDHEHIDGVVGTDLQDAEVTVNDTMRVVMGPLGPYTVVTGEVVELTSVVSSVFVNDSGNFSCRFWHQVNIDGAGWQDVEGQGVPGMLLNNASSSGRMSGGVCEEYYFPTSASESCQFRTVIQRTIGSISGELDFTDTVQLTIKKLANLL